MRSVLNGAVDGHINMRSYSEFFSCKRWGIGNHYVIIRAFEINYPQPRIPLYNNHGRTSKSEG